MNRKTGYTLLELLIVIALIVALSSLAMLTFRESSGAAKLSTGGSRIVSMIESARETAILQRQPTALAMLASGDNIANRVFATLGYYPPSSPGGTGEWKQTGQWEVLPPGIVADTEGSSADNGPKAFTPAFSVDITPAPPSLHYKGASYLPKEDAGYGYVVFMADGSLYQDSDGSLPLPCVLRLVEGSHDGTAVTRIVGSAANYFEIVLNQATGRAKVIRP